MKLYTVQVAPNPTKVELFIAEKRSKGADLPIERSTVRLMKGEQNKREHLARNPFGAVPVLEVKRGEFITESLPIIEYLEEIAAADFPQSSMWGDNPLERAHNRDFERIADSRLLMPIARYVHATNSPIGLPANKEVAAAAAAAIPKALQFFDGLLSDDRTFVAGEAATVADCTLAAALQFARFGGYDISDEYKHVLDWNDRYRVRETIKSLIIV
ncbi:MAG: glutathione S-transferase family protein [Gammaproteobacteria bacterium]